MKKIISFLLATFWIFLGQAVSGSLERDLKISLEEKQIQDLSLEGLSLVFYVKIKNSTRSTYYLSGYSYRFVVNQNDYVRLEMPLENEIKIDPLSDTLLSFPLRITYSHLFQAVSGVEKEDKAVCYLAGTMRFSDGKKDKGKLPFAFSGEFPLFKKPEIGLLSLRINDMTIGGADLSLEVQFTNRNEFELFVDTISYKIQLEEKTIGEGKIDGDKNINGRGTRAFSLPLLLNFFEVGKDVYNILQRPSVSCQFFGELKVRTIWGNLEIPFEEREIVSIARNP